MKIESIAQSIPPAVGGGARAAAEGPPEPVSASGSAAAIDVILARAAMGRSQAAEVAPQASAQAAAQAAAQASRRLAENGSKLTIEFDDVVERMVFRLVDSQTGEVVRQIPSREMLAIARALAEDSSAGVLLRTDA
jgi:flagellar protein FlaG